MLCFSNIRSFYGIQNKKNFAFDNGKYLKKPLYTAATANNYQKTKYSTAVATATLEKERKREKGHKNYFVDGLLQIWSELQKPRQKNISINDVWVIKEVPEQVLYSIVDKVQEERRSIVSFEQKNLAESMKNTLSIFYPYKKYELENISLSFLLDICDAMDMNVLLFHKSEMHISCKKFYCMNAIKNNT